MSNKQAFVIHVVKCCDVGMTRNCFREEVISTEDLKVEKEMEGTTGEGPDRRTSMFKDSGTMKSPTSYGCQGIGCA